MENSLYVGLSKQVALAEKMQIISNNVANINTPGFRGQNMVFDEFVNDMRRMEEDVSMVLDYGQYQNTDAGSLRDTGNPLDVALVGDGFLGVQTPGGATQYTRAGNMTMDVNGELKTARGFSVLDEGGGTITIPNDAKEIFIDKNGAIATEQGEIARLMIREFPNPQELNPAGNGLYEIDGEGVPAEGTTVKQGMLEGSNVQAVVEMTRMIEVLRTYQAMQDMMKTEHDRLRNAGQRLAKTTA